MEPISIGLGIVGLGMQLFGGMGQAAVAKQQAQVSMGIAADEQQVQVQKQQQMQLEAQRQGLQNFRNVQQAQATSLSRATSQGAEFGSGLQGGLAGASNEGFQNALGINQNLEIGKNIFGIDTDISAKRIQMAQLGGQAATYQGEQSLGGAFLKAGPIVGAFGKNLTGSGGSFGFMMGGGSPSGYGTG
jgi:hypothetical protein